MNHSFLLKVGFDDPYNSGVRPKPQDNAGQAGSTMIIIVKIIFSYFWNVIMCWCGVDGKKRVRSKKVIKRDVQ